MPKDAYAIEMDSRDKQNGCIVRIAMFDNYSAALKQWNKIDVDEDPDVWFWLVKIRDGIDDPAHIDALESKFRGT